jgi:hypothetical protein
LGYVSVEALRLYLFSNNLVSAPEKVLLDELANPQHEAVSTYSLPRGFEHYLSCPCPWRPVDFLQFIAYTRNIYEDEHAKGCAGAALPVVTPTAATVLATEKEAGAGTSASANREDGPDTNPAALPGKRTREGDVRFI